jgi:hypothetical protein
MTNVHSGGESFEQLLSLGEKQLWNSFERAKTFAHRGDAGRVREEAVKEFLRKQLPDRFAVASGEVIDSRGSRSGQTDVLIYDRSMTAPLVAFEHGDVLLAAESVLATVEVKTRLTADELELSLSGVGRLHLLQPWKSQWSPSRERGDIDDGLPRLFTTILSYETNLGSDDWPRKELNRVNIAAVKVGLPLRYVDRIVVLGQGLILPADAKVSQSSAEQRVLGLWFFNLMNFLAREVSRRRPFPWTDYENIASRNWMQFPSIPAFTRPKPSNPTTVDRVRKNTKQPNPRRPGTIGR